MIKPNQPRVDGLNPNPGKTKRQKMLELEKISQMQINDQQANVSLNNNSNNSNDSNNANNANNAHNSNNAK